MANRIPLRPVRYRFMACRITIAYVRTPLINHDFFRTETVDLDEIHARLKVADFCFVDDGLAVHDFTVDVENGQIRRCRLVVNAWVSNIVWVVGLAR